MEESGTQKRYLVVRLIALLLRLGAVLVLVGTIVMLAGGHTRITEKVADGVAEAFEKGQRDILRQMKEKYGEDDETVQRFEEQTRESGEGVREAARAGARGAVVVGALFMLFLAILLWASGDFLRLLVSVEEQTRRVADALAKRQF